MLMMFQFISGNCYAIVNQSMTFAQAAKHCSENHGKLASFEDREGWDDMVAELSSYASLAIGFWIGNGTYSDKRDRTALVDAMFIYIKVSWAKAVNW